MTELGLALLALLFYTYLGYPLLVAAWSRLVPREAAAPNDFEPTVSVCLAVSNGAAHLAQKLDSLERLDYPHDKLEILVCSDGSTDDSDDIVTRYAGDDPRIRWLENEVRLGKPSALNRLRDAARGDVVVLTDVRQPISPNAVRALTRRLADPTVGCVSGNLVLSGSSGAGVYWRYERFIRNSEGRLGKMAGVSGALYALRREDLPKLPPDVILDDMYVPLHVALRGKSVVFEASARAYDDAFDDEREFSRKVRTLAGNYQLVAMMPELLLPGRNRAWFSLLSHKLARLACPWALALLFLSSLAVVGRPAPDLSSAELGFWRALTLFQGLAYGLAAVGSVAGRWGALARTFVVLNLAAVVGLWRYARGRQAVTW
jgi:cellulose synthase/poly-beta-1,6-N-acetylglucosamine synthase-like glycosyltransferase